MYYNYIVSFLWGLKAFGEVHCSLKFSFHLKAAVRYIGVHQELFGTYEGILMKKPSIEVLKRTQGTFLDFLTRENLLPLLPAFTLAHTVPGYGYLDEVNNTMCLKFN